MIKLAEVVEGTEDKDSDVPICRALLGRGWNSMVVADFAGYPQKINVIQGK